MFENKMYKGIRYSRFIASWLNAGGDCCNVDFELWLRALKIDGENIPEEIIQEIYRFCYYYVGKMELEIDAKRFLKELDEKYESGWKIPEEIWNENMWSEPEKVSIAWYAWIPAMIWCKIKKVKDYIHKSR